MDNLFDMKNSKLVLWKALFKCIQLESIIRNNQEKYYTVIQN